MRLPLQGLQERMAASVQDREDFVVVGEVRKQKEKKGGGADRRERNERRKERKTK